MSSEYKPLYRDFDSSDLFPLINKKNITQTIIVQAADTIAETEFILDIANNNSFVSGVVGWVDFENSDVVKHIDKLIENGMAEEILKVHLSEVKTKYKNQNIPNWITVKKNDFIRVS